MYFLYKKDLVMKKLLAIVLVLFSVNCFANWTFVSTNDDNSIKTYLDFSTIKTVGIRRLNV